MIQLPRLGEKRGCMRDVAFLWDYGRATWITDAAPYHEIVQYCQVNRNKVDTVFETLSYSDGVNFATGSNAQALFSVALMDLICLLPAVFAACNHFAGPKEIRTWRYNDHKGGGNYEMVERVTLLHSLWG